MHKYENWILAEPDNQIADKLAADLAIDQLTARLLVNRGITRAEAARQFLIEQWNGEIPCLAGLEAAVNLLSEARVQGKTIVVYGDYDVDGICSTAIIYECLSYLGYQVTYRLPNRFIDGYGLTEEAVNEIAASGAGLLLTVDCGISAVNEVKLAREQGLLTIITDHHQPGSELPAADVLVNPRVSPEGEGQELCGAGVAFCLALSLLAEVGKLAYGNKWLDLVALATVADIVPLTGYNRVWVQEGLKRIRSRVGIRQLITAARVREGELSTYHLGYILAPRLNAAGRLDHAEPALELLLTDNPETAEDLAQVLDLLNSERQQLEEAIYQQALEQVGEPGEEMPEVMVLAGDGWHQGVIGIVASRVAQRFQRPAIIIAWGEASGKGSARSVAGFDILEALRQSASALDHFGGHRGAAGIDINRANFDAFCARINQIAPGCYYDANAVATLFIDGELDVNDLGIELGYLASRLRPYGEGNPAPVFMAKVIFSRVTRIGKNGDHFKGWISGVDGAEVICFREGHLAEEILGGQCYQAAFTPEINEFNGKLSLSMRLIDIRPYKTEIQILNTRLAASEFGQADKPELVVYPDQRCLELMWPFYKEIWEDRVIAVCGRVPAYNLAAEMINRGEKRLFLTTPVYFPYHIKKFGSLRAAKVWLPLGLEAYPSAFLTLLQENGLSAEVIENNEADYLTNTGEVWYRRQRETPDHKYDENQARLRGDKLKLRQEWIAEGGILVTAGEVFDHLPLSGSQLRLVDPPWSRGELLLLKTNFNPRQISVEFTPAQVDLNYNYLKNRYPDSALVSGILKYLTGRASGQPMLNRDRFQHDVSSFLGKTVGWPTLSGALTVLAQTGTITMRLVNENIGINLVSKGGEVRLADSLFYLEGRWELREWTNWEQELLPMVVTGGD